MDFKFKKGDKVNLTYGHTFNGAKTITVDTFEVIDRKSPMEGFHNYKLKGLKGWWHESHLTAAR